MVNMPVNMIWHEDNDVTCDMIYYVTCDKTCHYMWHVIYDVTCDKTRASPGHDSPLLPTHPPHCFAHPFFWLEGQLVSLAQVFSFVVLTPSLHFRTVHCALSTVHCPLSTVHCPLSTVHFRSVLAGSCPWTGLMQSGAVRPSGRAASTKKLRRMGD